MSKISESLQSGGLTGLLDDPERETELLRGIAQRVLDKARAGGADAVEVGVSSSLGRSVSVRLGEVETVEDARDRGVSVTVYRNRHKGSAGSGDLTPDGIDETVDRALQIARYTQPDPCAGLADAALMASEFPELDLWHPRALETADLIERARAVEDAGRAVDTRIDNSEGAHAGFDAGLSIYANSHGFIGAARGTHFDQDCILVAKENGAMQRDWWWDHRRALSDLDAPEVTGRIAGERTVARLGARRIDTARVPVLFAAETAAGLIGHLVAAVSGRNLYRRSSFLLDSLGERIFPDWLNLREQPATPRAQRSAAFDSEGVATRDAALVENGHLTRYVLGSYSARRLGMETTANAGGVRNLIMAPGAQSRDALIAEMGRGLIVTELIGQGVNLVTGDYSRGASGFWVENGEIQHPVEEITIAGRLQDIFAGLVAAGDDVETRNNLQVPSLLVSEMMVAGS